MPSVQEDVMARRKAADDAALEENIAKQRRISSWRGVQAEEGDDVVWYENADLMRTPYLGKVIEVRGSRFVDIILNVGKICRNVRHMDDPSLVDNPNHREYGSWDFSPAYKTQKAERIALIDRMQSLSDRVERLENELGVKTAEKNAVSLPDPKSLKNSK